MTLLPFNAPTAFTAPAAFAGGLVAGSLLATWAHRIPRGLPLASLDYRCPACNRRLGPGELVPVASFLVQRGRCRGCGARVSLRYPLIELLTAALFALVIGRFGPGPQGGFYLVLAGLLVLVSAIDIETRTIPNAVLAAGMVAGLAVMTAFRPIPWLTALYGFLAGGGVMLAVVALGRGAMGAGDLKLGALLGFYLGWPGVGVALAAGFVAGAAAGLVLIALGLKRRRDFVPFGPFLAFGALAAALFRLEPPGWHGRIWGG